MNDQEAHDYYADPEHLKITGPARKHPKDELTERVVRGLGYGLDEAAEAAARQIRFRPALQNGQPVDFPATARITFELAY